jgi:hypothetical protein
VLVLRRLHCRQQFAAALQVSLGPGPKVHTFSEWTIPSIIAIGVVVLIHLL